MSETVKRVLIASILIPIIFSILFLSKLLFAVVVLIASILMTLELLSIAEVKSIRTYKSVTLIACFLIIVSSYLSTIYPTIVKDETIFLILLASTFIVFLFETFRKDFEKTLESVSVHVLTLIYSALAMCFLIKLRAIDPYYLLYIWLITWMTDSGAYFSGKFFGKHKLNFKASPNKTSEGFVGGVLFSILSGVVFKIIYDYYYPESPFIFGYLSLILVTLGFSIVSIFGDLAESILKRSSGIKDSKTYIPGHGGMLDVMDSVVYTAPLFYFLLQYK